MLGKKFICYYTVSFKNVVNFHLVLSQLHINHLSSNFIDFEYYLLEVFELKMPWGLQWTLFLDHEKPFDHLWMNGIVVSLTYFEACLVRGYICYTHE